MGFFFFGCPICILCHSLYNMITWFPISLDAFALVNEVSWLLCLLSCHICICICFNHLCLFLCRIFNSGDSTLLNSFDNHNFPDKGIAKLCLVNELDDSLLLAASCNVLTAALISFMLVTEAYILECLKFWVNRTSDVLVGDGNIRIWKDYNVRNKQKLVTAFSAIQGHKPGVRSLNAVVDWQQQSGYLVLALFKL